MRVWEGWWGGGEKKGGSPEWDRSWQYTSAVSATDLVGVNACQKLSHRQSVRQVMLLCRY